MEEEKSIKRHNLICMIAVIVAVLAVVVYIIVTVVLDTTETANTNTDDNSYTDVDEETYEERMARLEQERLEKEKEEAERKAKKKAEEKGFKAKCKTYTYQQMARNPEKFEGTNVKLTGEVIQALYGDDSVDLRVNITKEGTYYTSYTDTVYVVYEIEEGEDKILEDDIITIYGTSLGDYTYTSTMGAPITLPLIDGKYITIND